MYEQEASEIKHQVGKALRKIERNAKPSVKAQLSEKVWQEVFAKGEDYRKQKQAFCIPNFYHR